MNTQRKNYIDEQYTKLESFINDVESGAMPSNRFIKLAVKRYKLDLTSTKFEINKKKLDKFFYFLSFLKINVKDKYIQFQPEPYQVFLFTNLYGFYYKGTNRRRFSISYFSVSRKNGKSVLGVIMSLYSLVYDNNVDAQCYSVSASKELANNNLNYSKGIVLNSPMLQQRVKNMQYQLRYKQDTSTSIFKSLPSDPEKLNSIRPNNILLDELHTFRNSTIYDMAITATIGIINPLINIISTRGFKSEFQKELEETYIKILEGKISDDSVFIMIFTLDNLEESNDPTKWVKANPNLYTGLLDLDYLKVLFNKAKQTTSTLRAFFTLNLNVWLTTNNENSWLESDRIAKVCVNQLTDEQEERLLNRVCYIGCDFSKSGDLTAVSLLFPPEPNTDEKFLIKNYVYKSSFQNNKTKKGGKDLTRWIESGYIHQFDSDIIDYDFIVNQIDEFSQIYDVQNISMDTYNARHIYPKFVELGIETLKVPQNFEGMNYPMGYLQDLIISENIIIDNEAVQWQLDNVIIVANANGSIRPMKNKSKDSIDSPVAIINAFALYCNSLTTEELKYEYTSI